MKEKIKILLYLVLVSPLIGVMFYLGFIPNSYWTKGWEGFLIGLFIPAVYATYLFIVYGLRLKFLKVTRKEIDGIGDRKFQISDVTGSLKILFLIAISYIAATWVLRNI